MTEKCQELGLAGAHSNGVKAVPSVASLDQINE